MMKKRTEKSSCATLLYLNFWSYFVRCSYNTRWSFAQLSSCTWKSKQHIDTLKHPSSTQRIWEFSLSTLTLPSREFNQYWRAFKAKRRVNCMSINSNWHEIGEYKIPCLEKFSFYFAKYLRKWKLKNRCAGLERETTKKKTSNTFAKWNQFSNWRNEKLNFTASNQATFPFPCPYENRKLCKEFIHWIRELHPLHHDIEKFFVPKTRWKFPIFHITSYVAAWYTTVHTPEILSACRASTTWIVIFMCYTTIHNATWNLSEMQKHDASVMQWKWNEKLEIKNHWKLSVKT